MFIPGMEWFSKEAVAKAKDEPTRVKFDKKKYMERQSQYFA